MKKITAVFLAGAFALFQVHAQEAENGLPVPETEAVPAAYAGVQDSLAALFAPPPDNETGATDDIRERLRATGFYVGGGVRTGLLIRHRDFGGRLGNNATGLGQRLPMTLYFASYRHNARIGEAWVNLGYSWAIEDVGRFGFRMGFWAHGGAVGHFQDTVHLGDRFVWANFFDDRLRFIGGQGGGTPITSGGWINANWLSYAGLRFFWVDPSGLSLGLILPDPGEEGVSPVNYLTKLGAGVAFRQDDWWVSFQFDNTPIYDDTWGNFYGGLRRPAEQEPIAMAGNIAIGMGLRNLFDGRGFVTLEGMFTNLGEDAVNGLGNFTVSPVAATFALQAGHRFTDYLSAELRGRFNMRQGDPGDFLTATQSTTWGRLEIEPHIRFRPFDHLRFEFSVNWTAFINSYYLALDTTVAGVHFTAGQAPGFSPLLDFLSPFRATVRPRIVFGMSGFEITLGYTGVFSRDQVNNTMFVDFRWLF